MHRHDAEAVVPAEGSGLQERQQPLLPRHPNGSNSMCLLLLRSCKQQTTMRASRGISCWGLQLELQNQTSRAARLQPAIAKQAVLTTFSQCQPTCCYPAKSPVELWLPPPMQSACRPWPSLSCHQVETLLAETAVEPMAPPATKRCSQVYVTP